MLDKEVELSLETKEGRDHFRTKTVKRWESYKPFRRTDGKNLDVSVKAQQEKHYKVMSEVYESGKEFRLDTNVLQTELAKTAIKELNKKIESTVYYLKEIGQSDVQIAEQLTKMKEDAWSEKQVDDFIDSLPTVRNKLKQINLNKLILEKRESALVNAQINLMEVEAEVKKEQAVHLEHGMNGEGLAIVLRKQLRLQREYHYANSEYWSFINQTLKEDFEVSPELQKEIEKSEQIRFGANSDEHKKLVDQLSKEFSMSENLNPGKNELKDQGIEMGDHNHPFAKLYEDRDANLFTVMKKMNQIDAKLEIDFKLKQDEKRRDLIQNILDELVFSKQLEGDSEIHNEVYSMALNEWDTEKLVEFSHGPVLSEIKLNDKQEKWLKDSLLAKSVGVIPDKYDANAQKEVLDLNEFKDKEEKTKLNNLREAMVAMLKEVWCCDESHRGTCDP